MEKRIDYRKRLENNKKKKRVAKVGILSTFGIIGVTGGIPAFASDWTANTPDSIQIEQGATSYTMKQGDTLWAIGMKINVNVNTLASVNNINLSSGEQYKLPVGTVIHFSESEIKVTNSTGQAINEGVQTNDSNKIVADKPIGTDVSKDVANGTASNSDVIGKPDNTSKLPAPNNDGTPVVNPDKPATGGDNGTVTPPTGNDGDKEKPTTPENPEKPTTPDEPDKPVNPEEPEKPTTPTNENKYVIVNVDTDGVVLDSTDGYNFVSESTDSAVETLENGNTVTTYTTTKVWQKGAENPSTPTNEDKFVTINVDTDGNFLTDVTGYTFVSENTQSSVQTLENGNTITTYTTTKTWQKNVTPPTEITPVDPSQVGNSGILEKDLQVAGQKGEAMHNDPNSTFYYGNPVDGDWNKGWAFTSAPVLMNNGETWYTIVFYVIDL